MSSKYDIPAIVQMRNDGATFVKISEVTGMHPSQIAVVCKRNGCSKPKRVSHEAVDLNYESMHGRFWRARCIELHRQGCANWQIAERLGKGAAAVSRVLNEAGLEHNQDRELIEVQKSVNEAFKKFLDKRGLEQQRNSYNGFVKVVKKCEL